MSKKKSAQAEKPTHEAPEVGRYKAEHHAINDVGHEAAPDASDVAPVAAASVDVAIYPPVTQLAQAQALPLFEGNAETAEIEPTDNTIVFFKDADGANMRVVGLEDGALAKIPTTLKEPKHGQEES